MNIRTATLNDVDALTRLYSDSLKHMAALQPGTFRSVPQDEGFVKAGLIEENAIIFVAEQDGKLVGLASVFGIDLDPKPFRVRNHYADLDTLYVDEDYRNQGIGTALWDAAWQWAKDHGYFAMELMTLAENKNARKFYGDRGMREKSVYYIVEEERNDDSGRI